MKIESKKILLSAVALLVCAASSYGALEFRRGVAGQDSYDRLFSNKNNWTTNRAGGAPNYSDVIGQGASGSWIGDYYSSGTTAEKVSTTAMTGTIKQ